MTQNARMFPPGSGQQPNIAVNSRAYSAALGGYVDVPDFDAKVMQANGWTRAGTTAFVGPTSNRPVSEAGGQPITPGQLYFDTTLTAPVFWDALGKVWRNVFTGAVA